MMGRSHQCYISSFVEIGRLVPEKKISEGVCHNYMGHLGRHVTQVPRANFRSPLTINFALISQVVSEKMMFEIVDDGRRCMGILSLPLSFGSGELEMWVY